MEFDPLQILVKEGRSFLGLLGELPNKGGILEYRLGSQEGSRRFL